MQYKRTLSVQVCGSLQYRRINNLIILLFLSFYVSKNTASAIDLQVDHFTLSSNGPRSGTDHLAKCTPSPSRPFSSKLSLSSTSSLVHISSSHPPQSLIEHISVILLYNLSSLINSLHYSKIHFLLSFATSSTLLCIQCYF